MRPILMIPILTCLAAHEPIVARAGGTVGQGLGGDSSPAGQVASGETHDRSAPMNGHAAEAPLAVGSASPAAALELDPEGRVAASGTLPAGLSPEAFAALLPGVDTGRLRQARTGGGPGWDRAVEGLSIVLPRFRAASARIEDGRLALRGELRSGFSARGARAALEAALPRDWTLALDIAETDPPAELVIGKEKNSVVLSGLLPAGLRPEEATALMGEGASAEGLAGGGAGDARGWSRALAALGGVIGLFDTARARVEGDRLVIEGVLRPGYPAEAVAELLSGELPAGWQSRLDATETRPGEGDRRINLATDEAEVYRRGFWMPELDFPVSPGRCRAEAGAALERGQALFVNGSAEIEEASQALVDRLAAIAVRCLNSSDLRLEIAGHTDSAGNDAENQALSEARAGAVLDALLARGVREDALSAVGHGESRPVASNDTAEGRARNNRIEFDWSEP
jgi:OOP family OmpA-OmpF porin